MGGLCTSADKEQKKLSQQILQKLNSFYSLQQKETKRFQKMFEYIYLRVKIDLQKQIQKTFVDYNIIKEKNNHNNRKQAFQFYCTFLTDLFDQLQKTQTKNKESINQDSKKLQKRQIQMKKQKKISTQYQKKSSDQSERSSFFHPNRKSTYSYPEQVQIIQQKSKNHTIQLDTFREPSEMEELKWNISELKEQLKQAYLQLQQKQTKISQIQKEKQTQLKCILSLKKDIDVLNQKSIEHHKQRKKLKQQNCQLEIEVQKCKFQSRNNLKQTVTSEKQIENTFQKQETMKIKNRGSLDEEIEKIEKISIAQQTLGTIYQPQSLNVISPKNPETPLTPSHSQNHELKKINQSYELILRIFPTSSILTEYLDLDKAVQTRTQISQFFQSQIIGTKLIYRFDILSKLHFQNYINNEHNIMILIDTGYENIIGGFMGEIEQNDNISHSFLFSLREKKKPYKLQTKNRVKKINSDPNYLNFGTGQLKLKSKTLTLDTNIGGYNCQYFFNGRGIASQEFIGKEGNKFQIKGYEIHKIYFKT